MTGGHTILRPEEEFVPKPMTAQQMVSQITHLIAGNVDLIADVDVRKEKDGGYYVSIRTKPEESK